MKKFMCMLLSLTVLTVFAPLCRAYETDEDIESLRQNFIYAETLYDYCYFSPVKNSSDTVKYPLIVWLHGNKSGEFPGHQLYNCMAAYWTCEGAQEKFTAGGAYIFMPRHATLTGVIPGDLAWDGQAGKLKDCIDIFIDENSKNIDTSRIYIGGYSLGGKGAFKQIAAYPDFYAAAFLMSPVYTPLYTELNTVKNIPIWLFNCKGDRYIQLNSDYIKPLWNYLCTVSEIPEKMRWTEFAYASYMDGTRIEGNVHTTWDAVVSDLFVFGTDRPFEGMKTVDGTGKNLTFTYPDGFLYWLNQQQTPEASGNEGRNSVTEILINFFRMIKEFFLSYFH